MRELIGGKHVVAFSPIIGCEPVTGPAGKLMSACGCDVSSRGVARCYEGLLNLFVVDEREGLGLRDAEDMGVTVSGFSPIWMEKSARFRNLLTLCYVRRSLAETKG